MEMKNMPVCDLRAVKTVESASSIHLIENVALVVFPQDAPPELKNALAAIPQKNVASTLWLHDTDRLQTENPILIPASQAKSIRRFVSSTVLPLQKQSRQITRWT